MKTILYFFFTLIFISSVYSQYTNVQIDASGAPEEPSIIINPKNTNLMVAGANINFYYWSTNGGANWSKGTLGGTYQVWGDPCMSVDTLGNFYFFHLVNGNSFIDRMGCHKSTNNGASYGIQSYYQFNSPKQQDKEWVAVDWTHGPRGNWIYSTWTQFDAYGISNPVDSSRILFTRSTDGGLTWLDPGIRLNAFSGDCVDEDNTMEGAVPAVGPNGEIYVGWAGPRIWNSQFGIYFQKSTNGGNNWLSTPTYICDQRGGWDLGPPNSWGVQGIYRANGLPVTACDVSNGPYRGNIYINYTDSAGSHDRDIMLVKSINGGLNWSSPIRVNNDPAGKEQFFTWMSVDQSTGYVYFVFYDRRNYTDVTTDVYMARSTDGGTTFTNFLVSSSPFFPNSGTFFGDYTNISAANGHVRPIWARLQGGQLSVWTAIVEFPVAVQSENNSVPDSYALYQNYPNPFNPSTTVKFTVPAGHTGDNVSIKIFDMLGKEVSTLVNESGASPGTYEITWHAENFSSGIYFFTMRAGNFSDTKKMILVK